MCMCVCVCVLGSSPKKHPGKEGSGASLRSSSVPGPFRSRQSGEASGMLENSLFPRGREQASSRALGEHVCHPKSDSHYETSFHQ